MFLLRECCHIVLSHVFSFLFFFDALISMSPCLVGVCGLVWFCFVLPGVTKKKRQSNSPPRLPDIILIKEKKKKTYTVVSRHPIPLCRDTNLTEERILA